MRAAAEGERFEEAASYTLFGCVTLDDIEERQRIASAQVYEYLCLLLYKGPTAAGLRQSVFTFARDWWVDRRNFSVYD